MEGGARTLYHRVEAEQHGPAAEGGLDVVMGERHQGQPDQVAAVALHLGLAGPAQMLGPALGITVLVQKA